MAGGLEWSRSVQPLLTTAHSILDRNDITEIVKTIIKSETEILEHDDQYEQFYSSFVALATHYLSHSLTAVPKTSWNSVYDACKILMKYLLDRLQNYNEGCAITQKMQMFLLKSLCTGTSSMSKTDISTFTAILKFAKVPSIIRTEKEADTAVTQSRDSPNRSRLDIGTDIFDQLTSAFNDISVTKSQKSDTGEEEHIDAEIKDEMKEEIKQTFGKKNLVTLNQLDGGIVLIDVCSRLTFLGRYKERYRDAVGGVSFILPNTLSEALTMRNSFLPLLNEISIVWRAFSLPILEPLTPKRLENIVTVMMSCLYASLSVAVTNTVITMTSTTPVKPASGKEEESENYGCGIIQKSLEIFGIVTNAIKNSTRAGGNVAQNVNLMAAWLLLKGLQNIMSLTPAVILERKDSSKQKTDTKNKDGRPTSAKSSFQGFGAVSVALATKALHLIQELMNDLQLEGLYQDMGATSTAGLEMPLMTSQTAWRRVQRLLNNIPLVDLLFSLVSTSFKKACLLRRVKLGSETSEASSSSASDSITFYEDDFSSSEDSSEEEEDDGAESILGHWMEETMSPTDSTDSQAPPPVPARVDVPGEGKRSRKISSGDSLVFIPDKREPAGFVNLAAEYLNFINVYFVTTSDTELQKTLRNCLNEEHMNHLSTVIKELDKETMKVGTDRTFENLSISLARLNHSLIATGCLTEKLQDVLLEQLNVSPSAVDPWPLTVHPRTLSVLAEVILLKQQKERESKLLKSQSEAAVITIWVRFMTTLKSAIINFDNNTEGCEDVNVEHLQLLIFLFHSLPLMQKKSLLLQLAQNIIAISELDQKKLEKMIPLPLSRLVLIFEYLLHYFYDPPEELIEQVRWNLFTIHTMKQEGDKPLKSLYFPWDDIEERYRKNLTTQEANEVQKPRFYNIGPIEIRSQDAPKVDGLACSFLLATSDCMSYNLLYDACISMLMVGSKVDKLKSKLTLLDSVSRHSHFLITWRLLSCLPPSVQYLKLLETGTLQMSNGHVLHTLRWTPRCGQKVFCNWIKDCLVKQGLTTQQSDILLTNVNKLANTVNFDIRLAMNFIQDQIAVLPLVDNTEVLPVTELPSLFSCLLLDCVVAKIQVSLDETFAKAMDDIDPNKTMEIAQDLIPATLLLLEAYAVFARSCILGKLFCEEDGDLQVTLKQLKAYGIVMSIGSTNHSTTMLLAREIMATLPRKLWQAIEKWNTANKVVFPVTTSWKGDFSNDLIPAESYIEAILSSHIETLSVEPTFNVDLSIKHMLSSLVKFASDLTTWCPDTNSSKEMVRVMFPLTVEAAAVSMDEMVWMSLERFLGPADGEEYLEKTFYYCISVCNNLIINYSDMEYGLEEKVFMECLKFMENHLESKAERKAVEKFFTEKGDLTTLLLSATKKNLSSQFATYILKFLNKLLSLAEKNSSDTSYGVLCRSLTRLMDVDNVMLQAWLSKMIISSQGQEDEDKTLRENRMLLRNITIYIVKEKSPVSDKVPIAILSAMIPMGEVLLSKEKDTSAFPELMSVMQTLAGAGHGAGHKSLFTAATGWLEICNQQLSEKEVLDSLTDNGKRKAILDTICCILSYVGDILSALKRNSEKSVPSDDTEAAVVVEGDSDWTEEIAQEDEDSAGEDSDEESLNNKLCTFTVTQKEFMHQHWYHCHDCKMVEGVGVCTVCAKVCHKGHDLTYAKFGSFFCDCGAKDDSSCKALVKRSPQSAMDTNDNMTSQSPFSMDNILPSSLRRRMSGTGLTEKPVSTNKVAEQINKAREALCKQVEGCKELLLNQLEQSQTVKTVLNMLETILPTLTENYQKVSPMGSTKRAQKALHDLHNLPKTTENTENLMTVTLGSQEGAFENVRMNYSGDQGQTIRQLITAHMIRRVAMCVLASPHGKRQHLAVSHEKGKITILQLSALLKQADSSKKKLTLTRLASAPIPFTVLSITGNPCNEDFLAVCGLKDCHVLTFTSAGSVADHLVLHPTLTTGNFIIKAIWLPGTQTELAIVTADFVKIYNLGADALSPQYFFLLPSGKIRDATFVTTEQGCHMVLMASTGYIYTQVLNESSSAKHGPFYITNVLEVNHDDLKETSGNVAGGGVSTYYSHALQLLFFSYTQGKSFAATVTKDLTATPMLFQISLKSNGSGKGSNSNQPLVQWSEVPGHVGLMYCMTQTSNNPVVLMIKPDALLVQEIKVVPAKAKIQDVVAIRHTASNSDQQRTTMILLCEDGSLRIYMANTDNTNYWLSPYLQPQSPIAVLKPAKKKKVARSGHTTGSMSFPVDFFEHCHQSNDVEFGGNDLLQLYNTQQIKHRLTAIGMYVASTKPAGFTIEINNTNATNVIVGLRVQVGTQTIERVPSYLEIFNRSVPVTVTKARWYDLPFTREESLTADKKVTLFVGASADPGGVTMVDSIKVYGKTKEAFGWPEETDEFPEASVSKTLQQPGVITVTESETIAFAPLPLTCADRLLGSALEVLDGAFVNSAVNDKEPTREKALTIATKLLTLPTPQSVQQHTKSLMASLFPTTATYYNHKDQAQLGHVMDCLSKEEMDLDVEAYQRLLVTARSVAVSRAGNLVKFAETGTSSKEEVLEVTDLEEEKEVTASWSVTDTKDSRHFVSMLTDAFWMLHSTKPANPMLAPVCLPGLSHVDATVSALVEIINAFTLCDFDTAYLATKLYVKFLMSPVQTISFACKTAIIRSLRPRHRRRRVFIPSPPRCSSPGGGDDDDNDNDDNDPENPNDKPAVGRVPAPTPPQEPEADEAFEVVEQHEPMDIEQAVSGRPIGLEELLSGGVNFPPMVDIPVDADDETMVELAIALSLQEQPGSGSLGLQGLRLAAAQQIDDDDLEQGPLSDTTASAPGSDDENGSNAATDGSTLRTSPAEQAGSGGSESGGSAPESISGDQNVSGRSSINGDKDRETGGRSETSSLGLPSNLLPQDSDSDYDAMQRLHSLRLILLERLLQYLPELREVGGERAIPFMQVLLMFTSDLDSEEEKDKAALDNLLKALIKELDLTGQEKENVAIRTKRFEFKLVLLRLLSVLLSRTKAGSKSSGETSSFISNMTASALVSSGAIDYCLNILKNLLPYWTQFSSQETDGSPVTGCLLKPHPSHPPPDMSPFFLRQYVKGHASDVFEDYPQLLTEMVLRLPYQLKKISESNSSVAQTNFDSTWNNILSEYMMTQQTPFVKRQVRKLLMFICGTKEKYRELRDLHAVEMHLNNVMDLCKEGGLPVDQTMSAGVILPYDTLLSIIEHLKACSEVATSRPINWQLYCKDNQSILSFLVRASINLDEGVAPTLLQLLQCALCGTKSAASVVEGPGSTSSPAKQKKDVDKDKDKNEDSDDGQKVDETLCISLIQILNKVVDPELMISFIRTFLLESNSTSIRWQAHSLVFHIYKNCSLTEQENIMEMMWSLWKELALYGRKAAQFVDLLGYFVLKTPQTSEKKTKEYLEKAIDVLREENHLLANHPNAQIYNMLQGLVDFDGYYLESDPCLVCNNPEVPYTSLKLSAIKVDSKFTTTTQIIKLVGSHNISKITLRISDLKRTKMVRVINFYYNNRTVQAVVELKNKPGLWHKAKKVTLTSGQTDLKVEFPIPIVACNLMIEYADFYDNLQATAETLQCPRCSASVPATPGVCGNCGENVFQCHKCRAINYDEKDPFLCNACGFCKYAKFDYTLTARQCCAVDPIENEEDRKKAITTINTLLEKADRIYKQLQQHRPLLEKLLIQVTEHGTERLDEAMPTAGGGSANVPSSNVNRAIQSLALKYCSECKSSFDELSKIIQKVLACRKELVEYDCQQREAVSAAAQVSPVNSPRDNTTDPMLKVKPMPTCKPKMGKESVKGSNCYGCASSAVEHCITLLRALVTNTNLRQMLCGQGMIKELIDYNLRHGSLQVRIEVRSLLCLLTKDNRRGTEEMNNLIMTRIGSALKGYLSNPDMGSSVRHEILLLATSLQQEDTCWEQRVRCVMRLFLMGMQMKNPVITDCVTLPCLRILQHLIKPDQNKKDCVTLPCLRILQHLIKPDQNKKDKTTPENLLARHLPAELHVNSEQWLKGDAKHSFQNWKKILPKRASEKPEGEKSETKPDQEESKKVTRALYLMEKYAGKWRQKMSKTPAIHIKLTQTVWLQQAMFSLSSRSARQTACNILESIAQIPSRKKEIVDMLTKCLDGVGKSGESSSEYLTLYKKLIQPPHWKYYLAIKGVMLHLGDLITKEVEHLQHLEETTLNSDLAQGFALKAMTELLSQFVEQDVLKQHYKNKLVGYVLNGYLSLRKLVVQRTKLIDDTQDKLLELLEELTSGTESETKEFMQVCVKTVKKYPCDDYRSPVFIFERLCSIIFPEENDVEEFLLILEKDPQQEDFLQGRMLGNPYSCNEPGLGPLMRDVKNKICQDCELVALLEDDNGMELLVNKKIISLDLPVKEVYKKVWAPEHEEGEPMPIIYRMRGLLGDATEDMVNSLDSQTEEDVDKEEVYKMAIVLSEGDGLKVMLERLASIKDLVLGKQLMTVLLKLFSYAVNVKANRLELLKPSMNTLSVMLGALNLALWAEQESGTSATKGQTITEQVLQIMEVILLEASNQPADKHQEFSKLCGDKGQLMLLLDRINSPFVRSNSSVLQELMRLIPFMAFGDEEKMSALINHFKPYLDFAKFDAEHSQDETVHIDCFCVIAAGIENNENGNKLKDLILESGIVKLCVDYIIQNSPVIKTLLPTDVANWKDFLEKPSLSYILRLLTGLCAGHTPTQLLVGSELIAVLHKLEQASSDQHIGTEAENLLEALSGNDKVSEKIEEVRQQTKAEKKKRAMAKREKQLGALGMMTNEKGQVTVKGAVLKQMEDIKEETGLTCCICREGYRCQPQKVLAIYTYTKRVNLDDFENKPRKAIGYSTVSHFNVIHVDCHTAAVRHARGREEWESAALQNANTKCNGLLPLWGPQVQESAFATCLARHNTYIQDCTGIRDPSYPYNVHDVKHLILKFAQEKSFSEESGGGGRQSNMHVLPAMIHMALYVINTTRSVAREEKNFTNFLTLPKEKWVENSYETEGAIYWTVMTLHIQPLSKWKEVKVEFLKRLIVLAQARHLSAAGTTSLSKKTVLEYSVYKPYLVFFGLVDLVYDKLFKKVSVPADGSWSSVLADYIRNNDKPLIEACDKVLHAYEDELLPCESMDEMIDVLGLLSDIPDPTAFMTELLSSIP